MKPQPPVEADWRRRHALNLAGQLPEKPEDALAILDLMRELVVGFLQAGVPEPAQAPPAPVITLVRERYADFGPTFAAEKLAERHNLKVSR